MHFIKLAIKMIENADWALLGGFHSQAATMLVSENMEDSATLVFPAVWGPWRVLTWHIFVVQPDSGNNPRDISTAFLSVNTQLSSTMSTASSSPVNVFNLCHYFYILFLVDCFPSSSSSSLTFYLFILFLGGCLCLVSSLCFPSRRFDPQHPGPREIWLTYPLLPGSLLETQAAPSD